MNWLRQLFCRHHWVVYADTDWYWVTYECTKCGRQKEELKVVV